MRVHVETETLQIYWCFVSSKKDVLTANTPWPAHYCAISLENTTCAIIDVADVVAAAVAAGGKKNKLICRNQNVERAALQRVR